MKDTRQAKIDYIANVIPPREVMGKPDADVLVGGWGGTYGHLYTAVEEANAAGTPVAFAHFNYINPLPKNAAQVLKSYKKVLVCELNTGQFAGYLRGKIPGANILQYNQVQAHPFQVSAIIEAINNTKED